MPKTSKRILAIDDDPALLAALGRFARSRGWDFEGAGSAAAGLRAAYSRRPDAVLLDVQLGESSGWELCRRLRAAPGLAGTAVVMISGTRISPQERAQGLAAGADDYLCKPFDLDELELRLSAAVRRRGG
jgi:DNA-binding response OmpR family regulator